MRTLNKVFNGTSSRSKLLCLRTRRVRVSTLWSDLDLFQESIQNYEYYESIHTKGFVKYKSREILGEVNTYAYFK